MSIGLFLSEEQLSQLNKKTGKVVFNSVDEASIVNVLNLLPETLVDEETNRDADLNISRGDNCWEVDYVDLFGDFPKFLFTSTHENLIDSAFEGMMFALERKNEEHE